MRSARVIGSLAGAVVITVAIAAAPAWAGSTQFMTRSAAPAAAALPAPVPCNTSAGSCWQPPVVSRWQYQLQGSVNSAGQCLYPSTGFINTAITGASFATGQQVAPSVFDIDIYQDGKCYTPNNYGILNTAAISALHAQGDKFDVHGIDADRSTVGNQAFTFIGAAAFGHHAGELRYAVTGTSVQVYGDLNSDGTADFSISVAHVSSLAAPDFIL